MESLVQQLEAVVSEVESARDHVDSVMRLTESGSLAWIKARAAMSDLNKAHDILTGKDT